MDEDGFSVNEVYTRDVLDEIFDLGNVYEGFLDYLEELKKDNQIKDFLPFAYDWRFSVDDIVISGTQYENQIKGVIDEIKKLAKDSYTGKVTIIGHSNGGLLAKYIMVELERQHETKLVDKVVFVGTPQVGTPKAIGAILHGLDQQAGGGFIIDDKTARDVIKNMAGPYGLMPSKKYFEISNDAVITQDDSVSTAYLDEYADVTTFESLVGFLEGVRPGTSINIPSNINKKMLDKAKTMHDSVDEWAGASGVEVYEIVGVGLPTIKGFDYREFTCSEYLGGFSCLYGKYSKPYPLFTTDGDETVTESSATAFAGSKTTARVNLFEEGADFFIRERSHTNLTESPTVQKYLDSIIKYRYQNETLEIPQANISVATIFKVIVVHSPVNIVVSDAEGRKVGFDINKNINEVPGGYAFTLGDSKYVVVPDGEYDIKIKGYATSTFSVTVDNISGNSQLSEMVVYGLPANPQMMAAFSIGETVSDIYLDTNGDGTNDILVDPATGIMSTIEKSENINAVTTKNTSGTKVKMRSVPVGLVAGATIDNVYSDEYLRLVRQLIDLVQQYLNLIKK